MTKRRLFKRRRLNLARSARRDNVGRIVKRRLSPRQLADKSVETTYDMPGSGGLEAGMR